MSEVERAWNYDDTKLVSYTNLLAAKLLKKDIPTDVINLTPTAQGAYLSFRGLSLSPPPECKILDLGSFEGVPGPSSCSVDTFCFVAL